MMIAIEFKNHHVFLNFYWTLIQNGLGSRLFWLVKVLRLIKKYILRYQFLYMCCQSEHEIPVFDYKQLVAWETKVCNKPYNIRLQFCM